MSADTISLKHITKIEGHAHLELGIDNREVTKCELQAAEGARFFEGIVRNRPPQEAFKITSRICGICSTAHVMAAVAAGDKCVGVKSSDQTWIMRRLHNNSERIRSHAAHLYFLALPDYLGFESALAMVPKHGAAVKKALRMLKIGNDMAHIIGGRVMHPISQAVGGWRKLPTREEIKQMRGWMDETLPIVVETFDLFNSLETPDFRKDIQHVALKHDTEFPNVYGDVAVNDKRFTQEEYAEVIKEERREYANATFCTMNDKPVMVGTLSRLYHNHELLHKDAQTFFKKSKIAENWDNPFYNNIAQVVESAHIVYETMELLDTFEPKREPILEGKDYQRGIGIVEAPRGIVMHDYTVGKNGLISDANIITPTAHNLYEMQEAVRQFVPSVLDLEKDQIIIEIEKLIRSYDPCFSCACHFLEVNWV